MKEKSGLHPRNKHKSGYDFQALVKSSPELVRFVSKNKYNTETIDFSDAAAVLALNSALLKHYYKINFWSLPKGYLCPPIPGRADLIHQLADLITPANGEIPRGSKIRMLDIGAGANCIYPLLAHQEYGWQVVGSEVDPVALKNAQLIVEENKLSGAIKIVSQPDEKCFFKNIVSADDYFHLTVCNPPFHASAQEAMDSGNKKNRNLGLKKNNQNFGGQNNELWSEGGEKSFILRMINESEEFKKNCQWFTTLVSKAETLPFIYDEFKRLGIRSFRTLDMSQGQKKSRVIAWHFY